MIKAFHRPRTLQEALSLAKRHQAKAAFLAGGTLVNSKDYPRRPEHLISLERLKLREVSRKKGETKLGALCTLQQLLDHALVPPALKDALARAASRNIRNISTLGGQVARRRSCCDILPVLIALRARAELAGDGAKTILVEEFVRRKAAGLITKVILPAAPGRRLGRADFRPSANSTSLVTAAVSLELDGGSIREPIVALGGVGPKIQRCRQAESWLAGKAAPRMGPFAHAKGRELARGLEGLLQGLATLATCRTACAAPCRVSDLGGSLEYKRYLSSVVAASALLAALEAPGGRS